MADEFDEEKDTNQRPVNDEVESAEAVLDSSSSLNKNETNPMTEFIVAWQTQLGEKDSTNHLEKKKLESAAKQELERFYSERNIRKTTRAGVNRENEQHLAAGITDTFGNENSWDKIISLVDVEVKFPRMKNILIQLKNS